MKKANRPKYGIEPKYILLLCTVLCLILIFVSYKFSSLFRPFRQGVNAVLAPMQKGIYMAGESINTLFDHFADVEALQEENEALRMELDELKYKNSLLQQDIYALEELRLLYNLDSQYTEYEKIGANVIAADSNGYYNVFTVDKGTDDGVAVDMNVVWGTGLVGIVVETGPNYARIRSIIDDLSNVSATIVKTNDNCMVSGNLQLLDSGYIEVNDIPANSDARSNYKVVTSTLSTKYLPNITIGYLSNIQLSADGMTKSAYVRPVVDFSHLNTVFIITQVKETPEEVLKAE